MPKSFLRSNPFIDLVVHNEGERTFVELLEPPSRARLERDARRQLPRPPIGKFVRAAAGRADARPGRAAVAVPQRHVRRSDRQQPGRAVDRPVGDQPRLPVPVHVLRLGLGDRRQGRRSSSSIACTASSTGLPDARSSTSSSATPISASRSATSKSPRRSRRSASAPASRTVSRCRTPRTPPSAPTRPRRSCPTPSSTRASRCRCRASTRPR